MNLYLGDLKISGLNNRHLLEFEINSVNIYLLKCLLSIIVVEKKFQGLKTIHIILEECV